MNRIELDHFGLQIWKHKTNEKLFLHQSHGWIDHLVLFDETEGRKVIGTYKLPTYDFSDWTPMTKEEYSKVKSKYTDIYE